MNVFVLFCFVLYLSYLVFSLLIRSVVWYLSLIFENSWPILLQIFLLPHSLSSPLVLQLCIFGMLMRSHSSWMFVSLMLLFYLSYAFPLCISTWVISADLPSSLLSLQCLCWIHWWAFQGHSHLYNGGFFISSISRWFFLMLCLSAEVLIWSYMWPTFSIRAFNILIIVILNSLTDSSNNCFISESGFDACSLLGVCWFSLLFSYASQFFHDSYIRVSVSREWDEWFLCLDAGMPFFLLDLQCELSISLVSSWVGFWSSIAIAALSELQASNSCRDHLGEGRVSCAMPIWFFIFSLPLTLTQRACLACPCSSPVPLPAGFSELCCYLLLEAPWPGGGSGSGGVAFSVSLPSQAAVLDSELKFETQE